MTDLALRHYFYKHNTSAYYQKDKQNQRTTLV